VQGHTDSIGRGVANLRLSKRRAAGVKNALIEHYNIDPRRLTTEGYGRTPQGRGELM
jgi:OOP family OmpA-OmpF porin